MNTLAYIIYLSLTYLITVHTGLSFTGMEKYMYCSCWMEMKIWLRSSTKCF